MLAMCAVTILKPLLELRILMPIEGNFCQYRIQERTIVPSLGKSKHRSQSIIK